MKEGISKVSRAGLLAGGLTDADLNKKSDILELYDDIDKKIFKHDLSAIGKRFK